MSTVLTIPKSGHVRAGRPPGVTEYQSWGRYPAATHRHVVKVFWADQLPDLLQRAELASLLPYGQGRSYGDSCLNQGRDLLDCSPMNRILDFDWEAGRVRVEAGISLGDLLAIIVPRGWFLPVTPGTKFVTVGGAIANDVHGKNHHRAGTFGCHVEQIMLYRSDMDNLVCSPSTHGQLYAATIGGLGLTGVIAWADLRLKRIEGNAIAAETIPFHNLDQFLALSRDSDENFEYTVAWVDSLSSADLRGIFFRGNHAESSVNASGRQYSVPFVLPEFFLNRMAVKLFNHFYHRAQRSGASLVHYDKFFYPLDSVGNWNLIYGKRGLLQYQCVVPCEQADLLMRMLETISNSGHGSFLTVLKVFGKTRSPGMLSFPRAGLTLAVDIPMRGASILKLLDRLDELVFAGGGALYPAKDARMSPAMFQQSFPNLKTFLPYIDPRLSSSFWRRVATD
jgi:FAD/FMN-containing dehydrogenase